MCQFLSSLFLASREDLLLVFKAKSYSQTDNCLSLNEMKSEISLPGNRLQGLSVPGSRSLSKAKLLMGKAGK